MGTNIYIQSDFRESYDLALHDTMGKIRWKRLSRGGRNRREIFELLKNYININKSMTTRIVPHGTVRYLYDQYEEREVDGKWNSSWDHTGICSPFSELVVYRDEMAHRGEGKEVMDVENAIIDCPDAYASVLLCNRQNYSISHRELFIGNIVYKLTYISITDDWRSNCGYVIITYDGCSKYYSGDHIPWTDNKDTLVTSPVFAFDYVEIPVASSQCPDGLPYKFYVDFNEAAGIPDEVVVRDYNDDRRGQCVPFSEIISNNKIAELIENSLKSERA